MNMWHFLKQWVLLAVCSMLCSSSEIGAAEAVRLNQIQVIGTHNSYKKTIHPSVMQVIKLQSKDTADSLDYAHAPLQKQFSDYGIRKVELDVFADPEGGKYAQPLGVQATRAFGLPAVPEHDPEGVLKQPGFKVLHVPDIDYQSTALTFVQALEQIHQWSNQHPRHVPILIMVELKDQGIGPLFTRPIAFDRPLLLKLEAEILSVFDRDHLFKPDDLRQEHASLREAIQQEGWPELDSVRGRVMFALDNTDAKRDLYLEGNPSLEGRLCFVSVDEQHPSAAWFKINDPIGQFERIQSLVKQGYMIRTRADTETKQARNNDGFQRSKALQSGAQFISTDYPVARAEWSPYAVRFDNDIIARPNPVSAPDLDARTELE